MMNIVDGLKWRYAVNVFDTEKKLPREQLDMLEEAMRLSPSWYGLQPWKFIVVSNSSVREKLRAAGYNQPKIAESSHLVVFAARTTVDDAYVDAYVKSVAQAQGVKVEDRKGLSDAIKGFVHSFTPEGLVAWAKNQAHIALGVLVAAGATEGIDVAPMGGFDPAQFDEILGLKEQGLTTAVIASIGFRNSEDPSGKLAKVRWPKEQVVLEVK